MTLVRLSSTLAIFLFAASAALFLAPVAKPAAPTSPTIEPLSPAETAFQSFAPAFDQSRLPEPQKPKPAAAPAPPPPDPTAGLKQYRFIGLAISEARGAGVFERGGETIVVTPGERLEGFSLVSVENGAAHFEDEKGNSFRLLLETAPAR